MIMSEELLNFYSKRFTEDAVNFMVDYSVCSEMHIYW